MKLFSKEFGMIALACALGVAIVLPVLMWAYNKTLAPMINKTAPTA